MKAYKLVKERKNGTLGSLFINRKDIIPVGKWITAENHKTKGFAHRPGWHCMLQPLAPHLKQEGRVWVEVEVEDYKFFNRPLNQGGTWVLANQMKVIGTIGEKENG